MGTPSYRRRPRRNARVLYPSFVLEARVQDMAGRRAGSGAQLRAPQASSQGQARDFIGVARRPGPWRPSASFGYRGAPILRGLATRLAPGAGSTRSWGIFALDGAL